MGKRVAGKMGGGERKERFWYSHQWGPGRKNKGPESQQNMPLGPGGEAVESQPMRDAPRSNLLEDFLLFRCRVGDPAS